MCDHNNKPDHGRDPITLGRREVLVSGAALAAATLIGTKAGKAMAQEANPVAENNGPYQAKAFGVKVAKTPFAEMQIQRRALRPNDILIDVLYCGICHSDIHVVRNEWGTGNFPCVPGHEIVGRVSAVGSAVTKFKVGDVAGIGCIIDSCGTCDYCRSDLEQYCDKGWTLVFNSPDKVSGGMNYGGYSDKIVVAERYAIRIPPGMDLAAAAPLLCAGITTFSPLEHWHVKANQRVGVIGLGGLGHMAVKLAVARKADVTVFTTSPGKVADAKRMGAKEAVLWSDAEAMKRFANRLDFIISTVPQGFDIQPFVNLLKVDGTIVNVGVLDQFEKVSGRGLIGRRRSLAGSVIGGIAETQAVVDYCALRGIKPEIELVRPDQIGRAYDRVVNKDVRYRFVIDMAQGKK
jgi:uncharacterized zinc-type alcohol dehydrogenase-like protein